jgi:hypothetical protein
MRELELLTTLRLVLRYTILSMLFMSLFDTSKTNPLVFRRPWSQTGIYGWVMQHELANEPASLSVADANAQNSQKRLNSSESN